MGKEKKETTIRVTKKVIFFSSRERVFFLDDFFSILLFIRCVFVFVFISHLRSTSFSLRASNATMEPSVTVELQTDSKSTDGGGEAPSTPPTPTVADVGAAAASSSSRCSCSSDKPRPTTNNCNDECDASPPPNWLELPEDVLLRVLMLVDEPTRQFSVQGVSPKENYFFSRGHFFSTTKKLEFFR